LDDRIWSADKPKLLDRVRDAAPQSSPLFELARVLVRLDHLACSIVNATHDIMWEMRIQVAGNEWNRY
jgi:hypothetical protein